MDLTKRVGRALAAFNNRQPEPPAPKPGKKVKEKLVVTELGAAFLDLSERGLTSDKTVSDRLLKSFQGWVYANVSALSEEISKMEFELYTTKITKGQIEYVQIDSHPLLDLLDRFNPFTTTSDAMYTVEAHLELAGDTFLLLDNPTRPTNMFILPPDRMTVNPGEQKDGYNILNYEYKPPTQNGSGNVEPIKYQPELIIQIKTPNPNNAYRGKSVVEAGALDIDTDNLAGEFLKKFFMNGSVPNFALSSDLRINRDDITRITEDLRRNYTGSKNAFKTLILGGGLKPVTVQQSNKETELVAVEEAMRDKIMAMFKNTKSSLGIVEDVNRANAEQSMLAWKRNVIKPKMQRIVDTLNEFLVPRFGSNLILTFKDPVPEDVAGKVEQVSKIMASTVRQIMTVNEAREILDLDPLIGDEFDTITQPTGPPLQLTPTAAPAPDKAARNIRNVSYIKHLRRNKTLQEAVISKEMYEAARVLAKSILKARAKANKSEPRKYRYVSNDGAIEYWAKQVKIAEVVEQRFAGKIDQFLVSLEEKALKNLHAQIKGNKLIKRKAFDLFNPDEEIKNGIDLFTPLAEQIAALAGSEAYTLLNLQTAYAPTRSLRDTVEQAVRAFTQSFVETDKQKLTDILDSGLNNGDSVAQIERQIRDQFGDFRKSQSTVIARTETMRASNAGAIDAYQQSGVVEALQWLTAEDGNVDAECAELDGNIVGFGSSFFETAFLSGEQPPLHPNCRCVLLPVLVDVQTSLRNSVTKLEKDKVTLEAKLKAAETKLANRPKRLKG